MKRSIFILITLFVLRETGTSQPIQKENQQQSNSSASWVQRIQQGYTMKLWMSNDLILGKQAWHGNLPATTSCNANPIGCEFPVGTCVEHLYGAGPFIGGTINGVRYVSTAYDGTNGRTEFNLNPKDSLRNHFWISSKNDTSFDSSRAGYYKYAMNKLCEDDDNDGKVDEDDLDGEDNDGDWHEASDDLGSDGLPDVSEKGCKGTFDPVLNSDPAFDNFDPGMYDSCRVRLKENKDSYTQNNGIPDHGEPHVDEDYGTFSDQDVYCSATDTFVTDLRHHPLFVKIIQKSYAYIKRDYTGILPIEYYFVNIGTETIKEAYVGMFADMDVGPVSSSRYHQNNYAGYFENERTGYVYNPIDEGSTPLGITLLQAPEAWDKTKIVFRWFGFEPPCGGNDNSSNYSCISCEAFGDSNCVRDDQDNSSLNDTRFLLSAGPIEEFKPGDTMRLSLAFVSHESWRELQYVAQFARTWGSTGYPQPLTPPSPPLKIERKENKVTLKWGCSVDITKPCPSDTFYASVPCRKTPWFIKEPRMNFREGYRVYRGSSEQLDTNTLALIAQYDKIDSFHYGWETGIETTYVDSNLFTGKHYWYSVTAYSRPSQTIIERRGPGVSIIRDTLLGPYLESSKATNATKVYISFGPSKRLGEVLVVPNPYRGDVYYIDGLGFEGKELDWTPYKRMVRFIHLPQKASIRIYTLAGDVITTIYHDDANGSIEGQHDFYLFSESGRPLANGIYPFTVESEHGTQIGKFVIAR